MNRPRRNPDDLAARIAKTRATLAKARTGELDPFGVGTIDHDWVEFLTDKLAGMEREADTDARQIRDLARDGAAQDAARALHSRHAMNHAEALARFIRDAGVTTARAWQAPGESRDARVYLPSGGGYLSVGADGSVNETERGKVVFYPSSLYRNMREAVKVGRQAYRDSFRERMERHDAERVAAVAKVRGNPRRGPVRKRPPKTVPFNPRATRTMRRNPEAVPIASGLIVNPRRNPAGLSEAIRRSLTPELLKKPYRARVESGECDPLTGHCYVASEAYYHMAGGAAAGLKPMSIQHEGGPHWWIRTKDGQDIDLTASQFRTPVPYAKGVGKGFLTREPSKRAKEVIRRAVIQNPRHHGASASIAPWWKPVDGLPGLFMDVGQTGRATRFASEKLADKASSGRRDRVGIVKHGSWWLVRDLASVQHRANPPVPTDDYRSGATRESTPLHIWWSNVLDLAGVTHAQSLAHRAQVNRWYQAGEPAWMAADGLRLLANARR